MNKNFQLSKVSWFIIMLASMIASLLVFDIRDSHATTARDETEWHDYCCLVAWRIFNP